MFNLSKLYEGKYYVYQHILDNEVFYIGLGKSSSLRAFDFEFRSKEWKEFVNGRESEVYIKIIKNFDCRKEAEKFEKSFIIFKSSCPDNKLSNIIYKKEGRKNKRKINIIKDRKEFACFLDSFSNKKLFKEDQQKFKKALYEKYNFRSTNGKILGLKSINSIFEKLNISYKIESKKDNSRKSETYRKRYWVIKKEYHN